MDSVVYDGKKIPIFKKANINYDSEIVLNNWVQNDDFYIQENPTIEEINRTTQAILEELDKGLKNIQEVSHMYPNQYWSNHQVDILDQYKEKINKGRVDVTTKLNEKIGHQDEIDALQRNNGYQSTELNNWGQGMLAKKS